MERALAGADVLLHLAWSSVPGTAAVDPEGDLRENVHKATLLLDAAAAARVDRVVFVSSGGTVYGTAVELPIPEDHPRRPTGAYGRSKLAFEEALAAHAAEHGYGTLVLRPANVYGMARAAGRPQGVVEHWVRALLEGRPIELWNAATTMRDLVHIDDMSEVLLRAVRYRGPDEVVNVGSGHGTTLEELAARLRQFAGTDARIVEVPGPPGAVDRNVLSTERLARVLGHVPSIPLAAGLRRYWMAEKAGYRGGQDNSAPSAFR
jgi:UDP-glucose 4-epimerase